MKIKLLIAIAFLGFTTTQLLAQEVYSFDFESGQKEWWTKYKEIWTVSSEKAVSGESSLKYSCSELPADVKNIQIFSPADVVLQPGNYTVAFKVWIEKGSEQKGISINAQKPWATAPFKFNKTTQGEWIDMSNELVIEKEATKLVVSVSTNPKWGGTGTLYIDDLKVTKK